MGKSELVKAYAKEYKKAYSRVLYYTYDDSLKKLVTNIVMSSDRFTNSEDILFHAHNRYLRSLGESVLLIIDNFNATQTQDELLHVMMKYRCKIIFTTRSNIDGDDDFVVEEIADINTLISLFGKFYNAAESHYDTVKAIIETVHKHTLAVELAARLLQKGILNPSELLQRLSESHPDINSTDKIKFTKDGATTKETYYRHIQTLFSLHLLENNSTNIMRCMAFIPNSGIESWLFAKWLELPDLNDINDLIEHGFIQENNQIISLHPMIREIVLADLKPSVGNCICFVEMLKFICLHHGINIPCHKLIFAVIENIIKVAVKDDLSAYLSFIEDVFPYMQIKEYEHGMKLIIAEMSSVLTGYNIGENRNYALLYHYQAAYKMLSKDYKAALALAEKASKYCDENSHLRFNLGITLGNLYRELRQYDKAKIELERCYKVADDEVKMGNETHDFVDAMKSYVALLVEVGKIEKATFIARKWDALISEKPVVLAYD